MNSWHEVNLQESSIIQQPEGFAGFGQAYSYAGILFTFNYEAGLSFLFDYATNNWIQVAEMPGVHARGAVISSAFAGNNQQCFGNEHTSFKTRMILYFFAESQKKNYKQNLASCRDAFAKGYYQYDKCSLADIESSGTSCPTGWFGDQNTFYCFKIFKQSVTNNQAAR